MIPAIILSLFLCSLPWVWVNILPVAINIRPPIIFSVPLILYVFLFSKLKVKFINYKVVAIVLVTLLVWLIPSWLYQNPHWNFQQIISMFIYAFFAYFASHGYLYITQHVTWRLYCPYVSLVFLVSIVISFYYAFGTLAPNTSITNSREFIQNQLFANVFGGDGKGLRHTMALIPVLLLAMIVHNYKHIKSLSYLIFVICTYLIFFTFSRSAWLALFLVYILVASIVLRSMSAKFLSIFSFIFMLLLVLMLLISQNPEIYNWVVNIFSDRIAGDGSTKGRYWVIGHIFTDTTFEEYLIGYNRDFQQSPHNMMLSALMHAGILGMAGPLLLFIYCVYKYSKGVVKPSILSISISAFLACALVRILTAGSGLLHFGELFGLFIAINMMKYTNSSHKGK